jgi:hypothetical protein
MADSPGSSPQSATGFGITGVGTIRIQLGGVAQAIEGFFRHIDCHGSHGVLRRLAGYRDCQLPFIVQFQRSRDTTSFGVAPPAMKSTWDTKFTPSNSRLRASGLTTEFGYSAKLKFPS